MASFRKIGKNWFYRIVGPDGRQIERKGCSDRRETELMASAAEAEAAKIRAGYVTSAQVGAKAAAGRPVLEHLDAFRADQLARGLTEKHATLVHSRIRRLLDKAGVERLTDLTGERVKLALGRMRDAGLSAQSLNHYIRSAKSWTVWLVRGERLEADPLTAVRVFNVQPDRRYVRRALTPEESARLVAAADAGSSVRGMIGPDRAKAYRLALATGFRVSELASLTPQDFRLDGEHPCVCLAASASKNRKPAVQPLPTSLAESFRPWLESLPPKKPIFPTLPTGHAARMMKKDLKAAGIPYETDSGIVDFHSLRGAFISNLVASGASVKTCQELARHSTAALTFDVYARVSLHDTAGAVNNLPDLAVPVHLEQQAEPLAATGTDDSISIPTSLHFPYGRDSQPLSGALACSQAKSAIGGTVKTVPIPERPRFKPSGGSCLSEAVPDRQAEGEIIEEAPTRFELVNNGFANRCLTTWLRRPWIVKDTDRAGLISR